MLKKKPSQTVFLILIQCYIDRLHFFLFTLESGRNRSNPEKTHRFTWRTNPTQTGRSPRLKATSLCCEATVLITELPLTIRDAWFGADAVIRLMCIMHPYSEGLWRFLKAQKIMIKKTFTDLFPITHRVLVNAGHTGEVRLYPTPEATGMALLLPLLLGNDLVWKSRVKYQSSISQLSSKCTTIHPQADATFSYHVQWSLETSGPSRPSEWLPLWTEIWTHTHTHTIRTWSIWQTS